MTKQTIKKLLIALSVAVLSGLTLIFSQAAFAVNYLSNSTVMLSNMNTSATASIVFAFKTSASGSGTTLTISLPTYTGGANGYSRLTNLCHFFRHANLPADYRCQQ